MLNIYDVEMMIKLVYFFGGQRETKLLLKKTLLNVCNEFCDFAAISRGSFKGLCGHTFVTLIELLVAASLSS